jgi:hypothetical protein
MTDRRLTPNSNRSISCAQALPGSLERIILGVRIDARRRRGVGMAEPRGDDGQRHAAQMQRGAQGAQRQAAIFPVPALGWRDERG